MEETKQIIKTEAPNSFEFRWGGVGDSCKLYFEDKKDLMFKIEAVISGVAIVREFKEKIKETKNDKNN